MLLCGVDAKDPKEFSLNIFSHADRWISCGLVGNPFSSMKATPLTIDGPRANDFDYFQQQTKKNDKRTNQGPLPISWRKLF